MRFFYITCQECCNDNIYRSLTVPLKESNDLTLVIWGIDISQCSISDAQASLITSYYV